MKKIIFLIILLINNLCVSQENTDPYKDIEFYTEQISKDANDYTSYHFRGFSKFNLNDFEGALDDYNKAIEINENYYEAYFSRGLLFQKLNKHKSAILDFSTCIRLKDTSAKSYFNRASFNTLQPIFKVCF